MKKYIVVKTQFKALHYWPTAPQGISEEYLIHPHRHTFYITLKKEVSHNDRDIEIIALQRNVDVYLCNKFAQVEKYSDGIPDYGRIADLGTMSCEDLAEDLLFNFAAYSVEVLEDNENGAEVFAD